MDPAHAIPDALAADRPNPEPAGEAMLPGFALDHWRVANCSAFRRLQYKTQVFVIDEGDHYRTRLTHTLEVAQISRLLAERLALNARLAEVIAIVHDLGHPPFGHAGEAILHEQMAGHGGFDHNLQALRVIDLLEHPYRHFHGLNLANVVRWAHQLHSAASDTAEEESTGQIPTAESPPEMTPSRPDAPHGNLSNQPPPVGSTPANTNPATSTSAPAGTGPALPADWRQQPLEGQVTNLADRIAYDIHDIEDALHAELVSEQDLRNVEIWRRAAEPVRARWPDLVLPAVRRHILDGLAMHLINDLLAQTRRNLESMGMTGWQAFCAADAPAVAFSPETERMLSEHESFLAERAYRHPRVAAMDYKARLIIRALFDAHVSQPRLLPVRYFRRIGEHSPHRVVCDYIAGMTDRFCQDTYHTLFEPFSRL